MFQPDLATPMIGMSRRAALDHRLQRRKDLLVRQVARSAEEDEGVGVPLVHGAFPLLTLLACSFLHVAAKLEAHGG